MKLNKSVIISFFSIIIVCAILFTCIGLYYEDTLDSHFGVGKANIVSSATENRSGLYYDWKYSQDVGNNGTLANAARVNKAITDEGIVLLKNNDILPLKKQSSVTPFGFRFVSPIYGGTGSGRSEAFSACTPERGLGKYFELNKAILQAMKSASVQKISSDGITNIDSANANDKGFDVFEFSCSVYYGLEYSCRDSVGIVFIGRGGGESSNLSGNALADGTPHVLAVTQSEKEAISFSKLNCAATVAVINSSNVMQIGELLNGEYECDAVLWVGGPGNTGFESLADILAGEVNPSGRTPDIWDADLLANPAQANFCDIIYENTRGKVFASNYNGTEKPAGLYYIEYEEGIYIGYKYYETAYYIGATEYGRLDGNGKKIESGAVNFPFGYGLSYTDFSQKITDCSYNSESDEITLTVEVQNNGDYDGEDVVQIYYNPPYTAFDMQNGIEKATKNLVTFKKVSIKKGEKKTVKLSFLREAMASYCMTRVNPDGTVGCYFLEDGDYELILGKNSHEEYGTVWYSVGSAIWYDGVNARRSEKAAQHSEKTVAAVNRFKDLTAYMRENGMTVLSRSNWSGTQPSAPVSKNLSSERLKKVSEYDPFTDEFTGNSGLYTKAEQEILSGQTNGLVLSDMRGRDFDDPLWERFLDQIDYTDNDFLNMLLKASGHTDALNSIGKPRSMDKDGPQGLHGGRGSTFQTYTYCTEVVIAATFNPELAYLFGESIGNEALLIGLTGWYGPGLNIHRSPFCGRNFEYYSEDGFLAGKMAASCISGAASRGVISYVKHFAMNNYEGPATCLTVWATEQTIRETYLRSFEIAIKEANTVINYYDGEDEEFSQKAVRAATGIMGAANCIGTEWCAANYELLQNVLRGEWGFQGVVITDMTLQTVPGGWDKIFRCGGDLRMYYNDATFLDGQSTAAISGFRRAAKNICYAYANSNLLQNILPGAVVTYSMSPWKVVLIVFDCLVGVTFSCYIVYKTIIKIRSRQKTE